MPSSPVPSVGAVIATDERHSHDRRTHREEMTDRKGGDEDNNNSPILFNSYFFLSNKNKKERNVEK